MFCQSPAYLAIYLASCLTMCCKSNIILASLLQSESIDDSSLLMTLCSHNRFLHQVAGFRYIHIMEVDVGMSRSKSATPKSCRDCPACAAAIPTLLVQGQCPSCDINTCFCSQYCALLANVCQQAKQSQNLESSYMGSLLSYYAPEGLHNYLAKWLVYMCHLSPKLHHL